MRKLLDNLAALFIICIILLIIIPLSTFVLDMMIIFNITISLSILLLSIYIKESLELSVFPSLLLITTLFRVGLNVSSTRLILGNSGNAGQVIKTFGEFVMGGNAVVGIIIFIIITVVQFIVITKGSERVAEVAARFTLDAMPGKQMAIDADLNTGLIDEETAKERRAKIQREADFYGAMDGASKFVKGDAIVSIIIIFINIIAGSIIGITEGGQTIQQVLSVYTIATVGDGLVSQIPALLVSTATGMIVTRSASKNSLNKELAIQIVSKPIVLIIAGGVLLAMCLIPGLPIFQLLILAAFLIFFGRKFLNKEKKAKEEEEKELPLTESEFYKDPENVYSLLNVDTIEVEFGYSLIPLIDERNGGNFIDRVVMLRRQLAVELGIVLPSVRVRDNPTLNSNQYAIKLKGEKIVTGEVLVDHYLALNPGEAEMEVDGIPAVDPAFGIDAMWIKADSRELAGLYGYTIIDPVSVIVTHLSETIKKHANELLGRQEVVALLNNLKKTNKALVEDVVPGIVSIGDLQKVLSNLLSEQIPIKDLATILETLGDYGSTIKDTDLLTEYVRQALKRTITRKFTDEGKLKVITLNQDLENLIMSNVKKTEYGSYITLQPELMQKIVSAHTKEVKKLGDILTEPVILASPVVRVYYKRLIEQFAPYTTVLSFNEIDPSVQIQSLGTIAVS